MKIGKGLLKQVEEDSLGTKELYSESTYQSIGRLFEDAIQKYTKQKIWFLPPVIAENKKQKKYEQIKKFINICIEFEISFEVVMDEQVKVLVNFIKKKNLPYKYPLFNMLISEGARKRMEYLKNNIARRYTGRARVEEFHKVQSLDIEKSLRNSMNKIYDVLKKDIELQELKAIQVLEILARAKLVSNIYVYSSPLAKQTEFLEKIKKEVDQHLSKQQKESVVRIKKALMSEFEDKEILKYV